MAGRARTAALREALERRSIEALSTEDDIDAPGMLAYVCDWIESGNTVKELAAELTVELDHEVTYARVMAVLRAEDGAEAVEERLSASRVRASHSLAETAMAIVDEQHDTNVEVSRAASRARTRQWMAERYNQREFGSQKGVSVSLTVGSLHLDALRAVPARVTGAIRTVETPLLESGENEPK